MASDLLIPFQCGGAFKQVHPLEDGIGSKGCKSCLFPTETDSF